MMKDRVYFSLLRPTAAGVEWPVVETTGGAGRGGVTGRASAAAFVRAKNLGPGWRIGRFAVAELGAWLEENQRRGTRLVLVNPQAAPVAEAVLADEFLAGSWES